MNLHDLTGKLRSFINIFLFLIFLFAYVQLTFSQNKESLCNNSGYADSIIYILTNRVLESNNGHVSFQNIIKENSSLTYVRAIAYKPDSLQIVMIDSTQFLKEISDFKKDLVLFVHGDSQTFEQAALRGLNIQNLHNVKVIVFSWPSKEQKINGLKNFKNSQMNVKKSLVHFNAALTFMSCFKEKNPQFIDHYRMSLFIHSLGNYYLENLVKNNFNSGKYEILFENLIINAAAVNQINHKEWIECLNFQNQIYIISNKQDFNLKGVRIFTKDGKQLGEKVKYPYAKNASYINFTKAVGFRFPTGTTHTYFIGKVPETSIIIHNFYSSILQGKSADLLDTKLFKKRKDGSGYDIIYK